MAESEEKDDILKNEDPRLDTCEGAEPEDSTDAEAEAEPQVEEDELARTQAELDKAKKDYLYLMADFDNFRKRTVKEKAELIKDAAGKTMEGLLPIVDDFERAIDATKSTGDDAALEGMELIYNKLLKFMESKGVKPMDTNGEAFNPESHEAIARVPAQCEVQKDMIIDTVSKGYTINGKVLRHAKVVVAK